MPLRQISGLRFITSWVAIFTQSAGVPEQLNSLWASSSIFLTGVAEYGVVDRDRVAHTALRAIWRYNDYIAKLFGYGDEGSYPRRGDPIIICDEDQWFFI